GFGKAKHHVREDRRKGEEGCEGCRLGKPFDPAGPCEHRKTVLRGQPVERNHAGHGEEGDGQERVDPPKVRPQEGWVRAGEEPRRSGGAHGHEDEEAKLWIHTTPDSLCATDPDS